MSAATLIQTYRQAIVDFVNLLQTWNQDTLAKTLPENPDTTYRQVLVKALRSNYNYIVLIQKYAGLPKINPPDAVQNLGQHDIDKLRRLLDFLGPYTSEALSPLKDNQLEGKTYDFDGQSLSIKQTIEKAIQEIQQVKTQLEQAESKSKGRQ